MEGLCLLVVEDVTPELLAAIFRLLPDEEVHTLNDDFNERGGWNDGRKAMPVIDGCGKN